MVNLDVVDMSDDEDESTMIDTKGNKKKREIQDIDINDEKVKDRWSRYIGAMGAEAVAK